MLLFLLYGWPRTPGTCVGRKMVLLGELVWQRRVQDSKVAMLLFQLIRWRRRKVKFIVFFIVIAIEFTFEGIHLSVTARGR
jgi:hypothetical protein